MVNQEISSLLEKQGLTTNQMIAAEERDRNVAVTAGAGSGKTRTLVARYLSLLAEGNPPDSLVAITFTEKAAREMRARIRTELHKLVLHSSANDKRFFWQSLEQRLDSARISTIHSLCAEILRAHPATAGIDPKFEVMEEGLTAVERLIAIENALTEAVRDPQLSELLIIFRSRTLEKMLNQMLASRLDLMEWVNASDQQTATLLWNALLAFLQDPYQEDLIQEIKEFDLFFLENETTEKGVEQVVGFQKNWQELEDFWQTEDLFGIFQVLSTIRKSTLNRIVGTKGKRSRDALQAWRDLYDENMKTWIGSEPVDQELEWICLEKMPLLKRLYQRTVELYLDGLRSKQSLDFDDLEYICMKLLENDSIRAQWQLKINALLVDEFQDTNLRQRKIVDMLAGNAKGKLFVVGDARQSIYRFRGADVSVFRSVQKSIEDQGGLVTDFDQTFRTHETLLNAMDEILSAQMAKQDDPQRPFVVPFKPMDPFHKIPEYPVSSPFLRISVGVAEGAEQGREIAANQLASHLLQMKKSGEIQNWQDVALLFRAASGFRFYEDAFEQAGIPFVTVAGKGFFDRPEVRDLLNLLRAVADPWEDLAVVGLLRSPAIGMSDQGITQLRWLSAGEAPNSLAVALNQDIHLLSASDQAAALRARQIFAITQEMVGRKPVSEILQKLVLLTNYRAILAGFEDRSWRNVDKILLDSASTTFTSIPAYLEFIHQTREAGAREGEAPGEAEQMVQLMTIHKAKGLEFPWVIFTDAGRKPFAQRGNFLFVGGMGAGYHPDGLEYNPLIWRLISFSDKEREDSENQRLLYVALTRAQHKLIINGHATITKDKITTYGWLEKILAQFEIDLTSFNSENETRIIEIAKNAQIAVDVSRSSIVFESLQTIRPAMSEHKLEGLMQPLQVMHKEKPNKNVDFRQDSLQPMIGTLLHLAIQTWQFPRSEAENSFFYRVALQNGFSDKTQIQNAIKNVNKFLARLRAHPVYEEIDQSIERYHELPYAISHENESESGRLDILYRTSAGWQIIDFKTDKLSALSDLDEEKKTQYQLQLTRYVHAVREQIGQDAIARICFLDLNDKVELMSIPLD